MGDGRMGRVGFQIIIASLLIGCAVPTPVSTSAAQAASGYPAAADGTPFLPSLPPPEDAAAPADSALQHGLELQKQAFGSSDYADKNRLFAQSARWINLAAHEGSQEAELLMGKAYNSIEIQPPRPKFADLNSDAGQQWQLMVNAASLYWLRKAASQGNAEATYRLGLSYGQSGLYGEKCPENLEILLYRMAHQGFAKDEATAESAQANCAAQSESWLRQAATMGHARAQFTLGALLQTRAGTTEQTARSALYTEALGWYLKAAAQSADRGAEADAKAAIAAAYRYGRGVAEDSAMALQWQRGAVEIAPGNTGLKADLAEYEKRARNHLEAEAMVRSYRNMLKAAAAEQARAEAAFAALPPEQKRIVRAKQCEQACETDYASCRSRNSGNELVAHLSSTPMVVGMALGSVRNCGNVELCQASCGR